MLPLNTPAKQTVAGKRIYVLEDNLDNRIVLRMALIGAILEFDRWGRDTMKHLKQFAPVDLIILDLMLPAGVTGYSVFEEIRADKTFTKIPIIAFSASEPSVAIPKCQHLGFSGFIPKPMGDNFAEQIMKAISGEKIWQF